MKSKVSEVGELSAELERLTTLVRQRRKQLQFLERCPHKTCECRAVWREVVEKNLEGQVGKINSRIHVGTNGNGKPRTSKSAKQKPPRTTK